MTIQNWFSVPIFLKDLDDNTTQDIFDEIFKVLPDILNRDLSNPFGDTAQTTFKYDNNINIIEYFNLKRLNTFIMNSAVEYCNSVSHESKHSQIYMNSSWINLYDKNQYQFDHEHGINGISGCYYYQTNQNDGDIRFINPNIMMRSGSFPSNNWSKTVVYKPKNGRLLLFPSWLIHRVEANLSDHRRISIAFNISVE